MTTARHFGSLYTMTDHKTKSSNFYMTANLNATEKLRLLATVNYNKSTSEFDPIEMPDVSAEVSSDLSHADFTFEETHEYSDLDYEFINVAFGMEYLLKSGITYTADVEYVDFTDANGYVYGDESGSLAIIRTGFRFTF